MVALLYVLPHTHTHMDCRFPLQELEVLIPSKNASRVDLFALASCDLSTQDVFRQNCLVS